MDAPRYGCAMWQQGTRAVAQHSVQPQMCAEAGVHASAMRQAYVTRHDAAQGCRWGALFGVDGLYSPFRTAIIPLTRLRGRGPRVPVNALYNTGLFSLLEIVPHTYS